GHEELVPDGWWRVELTHGENLIRRVWRDRVDFQLPTRGCVRGRDRQSCSDRDGIASGLARRWGRRGWWRPRAYAPGRLAVRSVSRNAEARGTASCGQQAGIGDLLRGCMSRTSQAAWRV